MSTLVIESAEKSGEWDSQYGKMVTYDVTGTIDGETRTVQINRKPDSPAPSGTVEGELQPSKNPAFPPRFKIAPANGAPPRGKSPQEQAQIARMNSHAHALKYWELKHAADPAFRFESWADYTKVVDLFFGDIRGAS